ncbi:DUF3408 domain-containing protein [Bacteroides sp. CG01]|uniref:DUF3408 domain-containing protein n=1 Tax=Bacteroides sp. CG01 TaxID=3096000 RepID=UPI002AFEC6BD|nr:DUF3408 domain-containing protein [Bacteroides sp. CG01]
MAKSTKSSKASDFDADKFLAELEEQSRKEKEAEQKKEVLIKEYSIRWNMKDEEPPLPGMRLNAWLCRWEPENIEKFIREHGEDFNKLKNAGMNNLEDNQGTAKSEPSPSEVSSASASVSVQPEHQSTDTTDAPVIDTKVSPKVQSISKESVKPKSKPDGISENTTTDASEIETTSNKSEPSADKATVEVVEQSKNTRVSSKMVNADFDELTRKYLHITSLGEKKPVFLPLELRNALETLARLSGVPNLAPSHIVINVLKAFFDEHRDLINRKLSGVKLSI